MKKDLQELFHIDPRVLEQLHQRLEVEAERRDLLSLAYRTFDTPCGEILLVTTTQGLVRVGLKTENFEEILQELATKISPRIIRAPQKLDKVAGEMEEYFSGKRRNFSVPLDHRLSAGFRLQVQRYLHNIPYGSTMSYQEVAQGVENPKASRAVGTACATNPLAIIVPCHRVLRTDGSLGGYAGGLAMKTYLLELERTQLQRIAFE